MAVNSVNQFKMYVGVTWKESLLYLKWSLLVENIKIGYICFKMFEINDFYIKLRFKNLK